MNFIIIYPPAFQDASKGGVCKNIPLGGLYLAESMIREGFTVSILDESVESCIANLSTITSNDTIAFGLSSMSGKQLGNALRIAEVLKGKFKKIPVIFGGAHATALPHQTLECDLIDYVVWGEGEQSLPLLLRALKKEIDVKDIAGIGYKLGKQIIINRTMEFTSLNNRVYDLPYHLIDMGQYSRKLSIGVNKCFNINTSRGCPYRCRFCSNSSVEWPNTKVRYHTIKHVLEDISKLVKIYGADCITFADEIFIFDEKRLIDICNALIDNGMYHIKYRASARIDTFHRLQESTLTLMKKTGFVGINIGIESGSERVLAILGKGIKLNQIYAVDEKLTRHNFFKSYNFMTCIPGEKLEDVKDTVKLILELAKSSMYCPYPIGSMTKFLPLPNTELFNVAVEFGYKSPQNIQGWTCLYSDPLDETNNTQRTWVDDEMWSYVHEANRNIVELMSLFLGVRADQALIERRIREIEGALLS